MGGSGSSIIHSRSKVVGACDMTDEGRLHITSPPRLGLVFLLLSIMLSVLLLRIWFLLLWTLQFRLAIMQGGRRGCYS